MEATPEPTYHQFHSRSRVSVATAFRPPSLSHSASRIRTRTALSSRNKLALEIRKLFSQVDETSTAASHSDDGGPLRKVVVAAVVSNPYAGQGYVEDCPGGHRCVRASSAFSGQKALALLDAPVESYGKAGIAGLNARAGACYVALTSVYGNAFRDAIGGGKAWITSVTKVGSAGDSIDVPTAYKDDVWVRQPLRRHRGPRP